jgi:tRNA (guanosine-2'-O-)-methyltransferase
LRRYESSARDSTRPSTDGPTLRDFLAGHVSAHKLSLFARIAGERTRYLTVVLEDIYQPHNASACLRSCDAFGVQDVHVIEERNRFRVSKDVALGAAKWLTLHRYPQKSGGMAACCRRLREAGYRLVVTSPREPDWRLDDYPLDRKTALIFGTELNGVSAPVRQTADGVLSIPLHGFTESLNVSVSVALCLHLLTSRLRRLDLDWQLSAAESQEVQLAWLKAVLARRLETLENEFNRRYGAPGPPAGEG